MIITASNSFPGIVLTLEMRDPQTRAYRSASLSKGEVLVVEDVFRFSPAVVDALERGWITVTLQPDDNAATEDVTEIAASGYSGSSGHSGFSGLGFSGPAGTSGISGFSGAGGGGSSTVVVNSGASGTVGTNAAAGTVFRYTLIGGTSGTSGSLGTTLSNPTGATDGQLIVWELIQGSGGTNTLALDSNFAFGTDLTGITLTTTGGKRDFMAARYNSTTGKFYVVGLIKGY